MHKLIDYRQVVLVCPQEYSSSFYILIALSVRLGFGVLKFGCMNRSLKLGNYYPLCNELCYVVYSFDNKIG